MRRNTDCRPEVSREGEDAQVREGRELTQGQRVLHVFLDVPGDDVQGSPWSADHRSRTQLLERVVVDQLGGKGRGQRPRMLAATLRPARRPLESHDQLPDQRSLASEDGAESPLVAARLGQDARAQGDQHVLRGPEEPHDDWPAGGEEMDSTREDLEEVRLAVVGDELRHPWTSDGERDQRGHRPVLDRTSGGVWIRSTRVARPPEPLPSDRGAGAPLIASLRSNPGLRSNPFL